MILLTLKMIKFTFSNHVMFHLKGILKAGIIQLANADVQTSGAKAAACGSLASLAAVSAKGQNSKIKNFHPFFSS